MIGESSDSLVAKVRRTNLEACLTCPLCKQLFNEATTIDECMHTFCKKCIHDKIIEEELDSCPLCNISLGCSPLDKLRPDHQWQNLRAALFPLKEEKSKEVEKEEEEEIPLLVVPFIDNEPETKPIAKKKERSLSSLVGNNGYSSIITKRRSKLGNKRPHQACRKNPISPTQLLHIDQDLQIQVLTHDKPHKEQPNYAQIEEATTEASKRMGNLCIKDSSKSKSINAISNQDQPQIHKGKEKVHDKERLSSLAPPAKPKRKYRRRNPNPKTTHPCSNVVDRDVINVTTRRPKSVANPIWFYLVAAENQKGNAPLPQIPNSYLRVKNANAPVSSIAKYIAMKLNLINEFEVEIMVHGQPILPSLALGNLIEFWQERNTISEKFEAAPGTSAKDVIMHLTYAPKYYS